ncbi:MAG: 1-deoxy-D-xylulose-5-phosphate reductoisomerase [bacterium]|jgi:1-deoxy-D-xylulose-5-phosphate reductoisomerase
MPKRIAILGSTGSIGRQALEVAREMAPDISVVALSAHSNADLLAGQGAEFGVRHFAIGDGNANDLAGKLPSGSKLYRGIDGLCELASLPDVDLVVFAVFGAAGLRPLVAAIEAKKDIAFACKEALVAGGELVMNLARRNGVAFLPIDSEHNSIWRCMKGRDASSIRRIVLSATGGPFRGWTRDRLSAVTINQTLAHPLWQMGKRITVNSATMMNKGLEIIEAHHLFGLPSDKIGVVVHPEGVIHGFVELSDGSFLAHASPADMKFPIRACLAWPDEPRADRPALDVSLFSGLAFESPDESVFAPLALARRALTEDWSFAVALNAANEVLVDRFLAGQIGFLSIIDGLLSAAESFHRHAGRPHTIDEVIALDAEVRQSFESAGSIATGDIG